MKKRDKKTRFEFMNALGTTDNIILQDAKQNKLIIYGSQSLYKQVPLALQSTSGDYDIFAKKPKQAAKRVEKKLDTAYGGDFFFVKPAQHPGTFKVISKGKDMRKGTKDDVGIVDYTKPDHKIPFRTIEGVRYVTLGEMKKNKVKTLKDKESQYRWEKDREHLELIKVKKKYLGGY